MTVESLLLLLSVFQVVDEEGRCELVPRSNPHLLPKLATPNSQSLHRRRHPKFLHRHKNHPKKKIASNKRIQRDWCDKHGLSQNQSLSCTGILPTTERRQTNARKNAFWHCHNTWYIDSCGLCNLYYLQMHPKPDDRPK